MILHNTMWDGSWHRQILSSPPPNLRFQAGQSRDLPGSGMDAPKWCLAGRATFPGNLRAYTSLPGTPEVRSRGYRYASCTRATRCARAHHTSAVESPLGVITRSGTFTFISLSMQSSRASPIIHRTVAGCAGALASAYMPYVFVHTLTSLYHRVQLTHSSPLLLFFS